MFKRPQNDRRYLWTNHAVGKLREYRLSESLVKRIIRFPARVEEGIAENTVAVMKPAGTTRYSEVWVMYVTPSQSQNSSLQLSKDLNADSRQDARRLKIITVWRYPGHSPSRQPVPAAILSEVRHLLNL